jgi:hypothetical protein
MCRSIVAAEVGSLESAKADFAYIEKAISNFTGAVVYKVGDGVRIDNGDVRDFNGQYLRTDSYLRPVLSRSEVNDLNSLKLELSKIQWRITSAPKFNIASAGTAYVLMRDGYAIGVVLRLNESDIDSSNTIFVSNGVVNQLTGN